MFRSTCLQQISRVRNDNQPMQHRDLQRCVPRKDFSAHRSKRVLVSINKTIPAVTEKYSVNQAKIVKSRTMLPIKADTTMPKPMTTITTGARVSLGSLLRLYLRKRFPMAKRARTLKKETV
jgi:hypothetical protein